MSITRKKIMKGTIVSHAGQKTAIVKVERYVMAPVYKKYITRSKRYKAHDEKNEYALGDVVIIQESRPLSKEKKWVVIGKEKIKNT